MPWSEWANQAARLPHCFVCPEWRLQLLEKALDRISEAVEVSFISSPSDSIRVVYCNRAALSSSPTPFGNASSSAEGPQVAPTAGSSAFVLTDKVDCAVETLLPVCTGATCPAEQPPPADTAAGHLCGCGGSCAVAPPGCPGALSASSAGAQQAAVPACGRTAPEMRICTSASVSPLRNPSLRYALDSCPLGIYFCHPNAEVEWTNGVLSGAIGIDNATMKGSDWKPIADMMLHPDDMHIAKGGWAAALTTGEAPDIELRMLVTNHKGSEARVAKSGENMSSLAAGAVKADDAATKDASGAGSAASATCVAGFSGDCGATPKTAARAAGQPQAPELRHEAASSLSTRAPLASTADADAAIGLDQAKMEAAAADTAGKSDSCSESDVSAQQLLSVASGDASKPGPVAAASTPVRASGSAATDAAASSTCALMGLQTLHDDDKWRYHRCSMKAVRDPCTGEILRWIGMLTDVHEKRILEQKLEAEKALFATAMEQLPLSLIVTDAAGKVCLVNKATMAVWRQDMSADSVADYSRFVAYHADGRVFAPEDWPLSRSIMHGELVCKEDSPFLRG